MKHWKFLKVILLTTLIVGSLIACGANAASGSTTPSVPIEDTVLPTPTPFTPTPTALPQTGNWKASASSYPDTLQFTFQFTLSNDRANITALSIQLPNSWTCGNIDYSSDIGNVDLQGSWAMANGSFNIDHDNQIGTNSRGDPIVITIQGTFDSSGSSASGSWSLDTCGGNWTGKNTGS